MPSLQNALSGAYSRRLEQFIDTRVVPIDNQIISPMVPLASNLPLECPLLHFETTLPRDIYLDINQNVSFSASVTPYVGPSSIDANSNHIAVGLSNSSLVSLNVLVNEETVLPASPKVRSRLKTFSIDTFGKTKPGVTDVRLTAGGLNLGCLDGAKTSIVRAQCPPGRKLGIITPYSNVSFNDPTTFSYFISHYGNDGHPHCDNSHGSSIFKNEAGEYYLIIPAGTYTDDNGDVADTDKTVPYDCDGYGTPISAFYSDAFRPILGVFQVGSNGSTPTGDEIDITHQQIASTHVEFLGIVEAEYVVWEVNLRNTFTYNATQKDANCVNGAQSWSDFTSPSMQGAFDRWNATSYIHCNSSNASPKDPHAPYQILQHHGHSGLRWGGSVDSIYMFTARVIDPNFRYRTSHDHAFPKRGFLVSAT